jgi:hypothetical protein
MNPCIEWSGCRNRAGYGSKKVGGKTMLAHRWVFETEKGPIPDGLYVLHHCDNPPCVNPEHLFLGTHQDNMDDRQRKGRTCPPPPTKGSACPWSRLSDADAAIIRHLAHCDVNQPRLAKLYGISQTMVSRIKLRKAWAHVPDLEVRP